MSVPGNVRAYRVVIQVGRLAEDWADLGCCRQYGSQIRRSVNVNEISIPSGEKGGSVDVQDQTGGRTTGGFSERSGTRVEIQERLAIEWDGEEIASLLMIDSALWMIDAAAFALVIVLSVPGNPRTIATEKNNLGRRPVCFSGLSLPPIREWWQQINRAPGSRGSGSGGAEGPG
jgi:hypothetical protein